MITLKMEDHHAMHQEGWCVTLAEEGYRLQRIPGSRVFKDDACAWLHVFDRALAREPLAMKVLQFLQDHGQQEFAAFAKYVSVYRPKQVQHLKEGAI